MIIVRKLLLSKKSKSILVGIVVGICAYGLTSFAGGSSGRTDSFVFNQNFGAQNKVYWEDDQATAIGVTKVLGVPIWDNGQGLGSRMPNLVSQPTQSPVVFFGKNSPVEDIRILSNLFVILSALVVLNLTVFSWSDRRIYRRLIFMDVAILGPYFLFTAVNDWFVIADQYWAVSLIISGFLHPSWYQASDVARKLPRPSIVLFAFIIGSSFLLTGHVLYISLAIVVLLAFVGTNFLKLIKILGPIAILMLIILGVALTIPQLLELSSQTWDTNTLAHSSQPSVFDIFVPQELRVYRFQPLLAFVTASIQPFLRLANEAGSRTDFFSLLLVPYIVQNFSNLRKRSSPLSQMLETSVMAIAFIFLNLTFAGLLSRSGFPVISTLFDFHVWQLSMILLLIVIVVATILFGTDRKESDTSKFLQISNRLIMATGITVALMYPLVMVIKDGLRWNPRIVTNEFAKNDFDLTGESIGLDMKFRGILLNEATIQSMTGIDKKIVRSGYPLINSEIYGRSSITLRHTEQSFRSVFDPSVLDCQPEVLDLLAVNAIVFESGADDVCNKNLRSYYQSSNEISFSKIPGTASVLSAKPRQFSSWSIATSRENNPIEPCPLFEKNCLAGLTVTKLEPDSGTPFKLCEDKCVFTYRWSAPASAKQVLVPENYDKTIQIRDSSTGVILNTANYQGLLAVEVPSGVTYGEFEATIKPDAMMWARVSATYLHTFVLLATLLLIAVRGFRARINDKGVATAS